MRIAFCCLIAVTCCLVEALETPLVLTMPEGTNANTVGVINPEHGSVLLFNATDGRNRLLDTHNFLTDLRLFAATPASARMRADAPEFTPLPAGPRISNRSCPACKCCSWRAEQASVGNTASNSRQR